MLIVRRNALNLLRRLLHPLNRIIRPYPVRPGRHVPLQPFDQHRSHIVICQIHARHHRDPAVPPQPQVLAETLRLPLRTLVVVRGPEPDLALQHGLRGERDGAVPARVDLERQTLEHALLRLRVVPEQVPRQVPAAVGGDLEERVPVHAPRDPEVVERRVPADEDPVHGADHVRGLPEALVQQLQDVLGADGDVVEEHDGQAWGFGCGGEVVEQRLQSLVAQLRKADNAVGPGCLGVDLVGLEEVPCAQSLDLVAQEHEYLVGSVGGAAFDDGEGAVGGAEELHGLDDGAEEAGEDMGALGEIEREEVL